jgi:HEAT repeat protein
MTVEKALEHLRSNNTEEQLGALRELSSLTAMLELYDATVANLSSPDDRVVFFSLDMLIKKYAAQVQRDAELLTPQLIQLLTTGNGPVIDRAIWALSVTGEKSIDELIRCITSSTDERGREACT